MDGTIITTKSGAAFPVDGSDWKFWDPSVPEVMRKHHKEGMTTINLNSLPNRSQHNQQIRRHKIDIIFLLSYFPFEAA